MDWRTATVMRIENLSNRVRCDQLDIRVLSAMLEADNKGISKHPEIETKFGRIFVVVGGLPIGDFSDTKIGREKADELLQVAINTNEGVVR